MEKGNGLIHIQ